MDRLRRLPISELKAYDPTVAFGPDGIAYYSLIEEKRISDTARLRLAIWESIDGGEHWTDSAYVPAVGREDKSHMAVDATNSAYSGNLYLAYTEFGSGQPPYSVNFSRRSAGDDTLSTPCPISGDLGRTRLLQVNRRRQQFQ